MHIKYDPLSAVFPIQYELWIGPLHYFASCQLLNVCYALLLFDILFNIASNATLNIFLFLFHSIALIFKTPRAEGTYLFTITFWPLYASHLNFTIRLTNNFTRCKFKLYIYLILHAYFNLESAIYDFFSCSKTTKSCISRITRKAYDLTLHNSVKCNWGL